ncbi:Telomerase reverse transcriptase [Holothuria leucospilota]|uniref:Telomerase reverse transcriptase n=1 Tax=Holothuria leucospilota TaxID=206669 RepID=A0A9Q1BPR2_HOLLE|nr:Telomerase reverse transcriptase [Holothuria leucospilota]
MKRIPQRLRKSKDLLKQLLINFKKTRLQVFHQKPVTEVGVTHHEMEEQADNHQHLLAPPESSSRSSTELTLVRESSMISKECISHLGKTDALNNEICPEKVALETDGRANEKDDVRGMESIENRLKESDRSESCQTLGGKIFTDTHFEMQTKANHIDVMEGQSVSLAESISQTGNTSALKKNMLPNILEGISYTGGQNSFVRETEIVNGSKDAKENSFEKLVTDDCSGSISSVLEGSIELFSSPESVGKVREGLAPHEMGVIAQSCSDSSFENIKKLDKHAECEFVRKHAFMATTDENKQAQLFQKCFVNFVKGRSSQQSSGSSADLDNKGCLEKDEMRETKRNSLHLLDTANQKELNKISDCQNVDVCVRESPLQQDVGNCGKDALMSSSSGNALNSGKVERDGTHFDGEIRRVQMSETEVVNLVGEDNEPFLEAQEKLENAVDLTIPGMESIQKTTEVDTILEQNIRPVLDKNSQTMRTRVFANILDSCDDVIMNEDEFVNEECQTKLESTDIVQPLGKNLKKMITAIAANNSDGCQDVIMNKDEFVKKDSQTKLKSCLGKLGIIDVCKTVVLEGNLLESCDDVEMDEGNFLCEIERDKDGEVKEPSNEVLHSEQSREKDSLPRNSSSSSKERRATIRNLRMQLKQKLRQKNNRRKNSVPKNFHSGKNRFSREREQHQCYHGNRRDIIKASRRKHRNVTHSDNRCLQKWSSVSRYGEKDSMQGRDKVQKSNGLLREPCHPENGTVRCFPCVQPKSSDESIQISLTDGNISGMEEEVESLASNLHIHAHSGKTGESVHDRKYLCHKPSASMKNVKWTVSRSKQRSIQWCHHSNSNLKSLHRKTQRLLKRQITRKKNRNVLSFQFGQDSPLAKGLSGGEVYISVRGLLKEIIPEQLWGSTANKNVFFKYLKLLLKLGRFEKLPLSLMTRSVKYSDCEWTRGTKEDWKRRPKTDRIKRKELMERLFEWLMTDLVVPLTRVVMGNIH